MSPSGRLGLVTALGATLFSLPALGETLDQAMAHAYENNPEIASAFVSVRSAREAIALSEGALLPTIGAQANIGSSWNNATNTWTPSDSIGLGYEQTLFDANASDAAIKGAKAQYDAAIFGAANTEQNVLLNVAQAYVDVLSARQIAATRQETIGFVSAQLQSARDRLALGEGTELDVAQAQSSLAQARASYQAAINAQRTAEATYTRHVGHEPGVLSRAPVAQALLPASLDEALAQASAHHPALLATAAQVQAAQFGYAETLAGFGPNLSLNANVGAGGWTTDTVTTNVSIALQLSVPIYTPTRMPSIERANVGRIQSQLDGLATRDQIVEAVHQSWAGLEAAIAQIEAATAAVAASDIALDAIIDQNDVGQSTTLDVLDQRASLASAQEILIDAQAQRTIAAYSLVAATGTLSAQALSLPVQQRTADGAPASAQPAPLSDPWSGLR